MLALGWRFRFGHTPDEIKSRISKFTNGIRITAPFKEGYHRESTVTYIDGLKHSKDVFEVIIKKGETVERNKKMNNIYSPTSRDQTGIGLHIFAMAFLPSDLQYVNDVGIRKLGNGKTVSIPSADEATEDADRKVRVEFCFGDTEIRVEAFNAFTGHRAECSVDFLQ